MYDCLEVLATWYEDRALHDVGYIRMRDWWAARSAAPLSTGAALTFWVTLENEFEVVKGPTTLPDAIVAGMKSTALAEFEHVYCMCFPQVQTLTNMPDGITLIDATAVMRFEDFQRGRPDLAAGVPLFGRQHDGARGFVDDRAIEHGLADGCVERVHRARLAVGEHLG